MEFWDLIVKNSPAIIIAITGFVALFIGQKDTKKSITNSHPKHLRDDMDNKHDEMMNVIKEMKHDMQKRFDRMEEREAVMLERVGNIEDNANREHRNIWTAISGIRKRHEKG